MIQSRPTLKSKSTVRLSLTLIIIAILIFPISSLFGRYTALVQLGCVFLAALSVHLLLKYVVYDYLYTLEEDRLIIHKVTKRKSVCVADIFIKDMISLPLKESEYKATSKDGAKLYTFVKNPDADEIRYIRCKLDDTEYMIKFEPDALFLMALTERITQEINPEETINEQL